MTGAACGPYWMSCGMSDSTMMDEHGRGRNRRVDHAEIEKAGRDRRDHADQHPAPSDAIGDVAGERDGDEGTTAAATPQE